MCINESRDLSGASEIQVFCCLVKTSVFFDIAFRKSFLGLSALSLSISFVTFFLKRTRVLLIIRGVFIPLDPWLSAI